MALWRGDGASDSPAACDRTRLPAGRPGESAVPGTWLVGLVLGGPDGLVREARVVRGGDTVSVPVVADGGFAAIACRRPGRTTRDRTPG